MRNKVILLVLCLLLALFSLPVCKDAMAYSPLYGWLKKYTDKKKAEGHAEYLLSEEPAWVEDLLKYAEELLGDEELTDEGKAQAQGLVTLLQALADKTSDPELKKKLLAMADELEDEIKKQEFVEALLAYAEEKSGGTLTDEEKAKLREAAEVIADWAFGEPSEYPSDKEEAILLLVDIIDGDDDKAPWAIVPGIGKAIEDKVALTDEEKGEVGDVLLYWLEVKNQKKKEAQEARAALKRRIEEIVEESKEKPLGYDEDIKKKLDKEIKAKKKPLVADKAKLLEDLASGGNEDEEEAEQEGEKGYDYRRWWADAPAGSNIRKPISIMIGEGRMPWWRRLKLMADLASGGKELDRWFEDSPAGLNIRKGEKGSKEYELYQLPGNRWVTSEDTKGKKGGKEYGLDQLKELRQTGKEIKRIGRMVGQGKPLNEVENAWAAFVRQNKDADLAAAIIGVLQEASREMKTTSTSSYYEYNSKGRVVSKAEKVESSDAPDKTTYTKTYMEYNSLGRVSSQEETVYSEEAAPAEGDLRYNKLGEVPPKYESIDAGTYIGEVKKRLYAVAVAITGKELPELAEEDWKRLQDEISIIEPYFVIPPKAIQKPPAVQRPRAIEKPKAVERLPAERPRVTPRPPAAEGPAGAPGRPGTRETERRTKER